MKRKHPYRWSLRSRAAITDFLAQDWRCYSQRHGSFLFSWCVKVDLNSNQRMGKAGEEPVDARFDMAWEEYLERNDSLFWLCCEDAARYYLEDGYTSYPGDDQGDWKMTQCGRSGGYLALTAWRGYSLDGYGEQAIRDFCEEMPFKDLRAFYRGIVCLDHDLTREKASAEVAFHLNFQRSQWEESLVAAETVAARSLEESRPDLYPNS